MASNDLLANPDTSATVTGDERLMDSFLVFRQNTTRAIEDTEISPLTLVSDLRTLRRRLCSSKRQDIPALQSSLNVVIDSVEAAGELAHLLMCQYVAYCE